MREVEVVTATVDIDEVVSYRAAVSSLQSQAAAHQPLPQVNVNFRICEDEAAVLYPTPPTEPRYHAPEEEIALGKGLLPRAWR